MSALAAKKPILPVLALCLAIGCGRKSKGQNAESEPSVAPEASAQPSQPAALLPNERQDAPHEGPIVKVSAAQLRERLASSGAKGTLVNAWASWCGSCRREFPMLISMRDNLKSQGIEVMFLSVDEPESEGAAINFASQRGLEGPVLVAERPLGPVKQALHPKWPGMLPATFLFDETGKLRYFWGGPVYESELLPVIEGFLAGNDIDGQANFGLRRGKTFREGE